MSLSAGYHVTFQSGSGTSAVTWDYVIDPTRYTWRYITPVVTKFTGGPTKYQDFTAWSVVAQDDWKAGAGATDFGSGYSEGYGINARGDGCITLALDATHTASLTREIVKFVPYKGDHLYLYALHSTATNVGVVSYFTTSTAGSGWTASSTFSDIPTDGCVFGGYLYVVFGTATAGSKAQKYTEVTTPAWSSAGDWYGALICANNETLWRSTDTAVSSSSDGATWGTDIPVGDSNSTITAIAVCDGELFVAKPEGLYRVDNGTAIVEITKFSFYSTDNGAGMHEWQGNLYIPIGHGLWRYSAGTIKDVSPGKGAYDMDPDGWQGNRPTYREMPTGYWGKVITMAGSPTCLYAQVATGTNQLFYLFDEISWHCWETAASSNGKAIAHVSGLEGDSGKRRLFRSTGSAGQVAESIILPTYSDDIVSTNETLLYRTGTYSTASSPAGQFTTPWITCDLLEIQKYWDSVHLLIENTATNRTCTIEAKTENDDWWTVGTISSTISPAYSWSQKYINKVSRLLRFRISFDGSGTVTPILWCVNVNYMPYITPRLKAFVFPVKTGLVKKTDGTEEDFAAYTIQGEMDTLAGKQAPLEYFDWLGNHAWVNITNIVPTVERVMESTGTHADVMFTMNVLEVGPGVHNSISG